MNGLDPRGIGEIRALLTAVNEAGTTVVLSSHLLGEVDALCDRVALMDVGRPALEEDLTASRAPTGGHPAHGRPRGGSPNWTGGRHRSGVHLAVRDDGTGRR